MSHIKRYLPKSPSRLIVVLALVAGLIFGTASSSSAATKPTSTPAQQAQAAADAVAFITAVKIVMNDGPRTKLMKFHGRSRGFVAQPPPLVLAPNAASFPGAKTIKLTLSKRTSADFKKWMKDHSSLSDVFAAAGAGAACAVMALIGTPIASVLAGVGCTAFLLTFWAQIKDATSRMTSRKACFQSKVYMFMGSTVWVSFDAVRCPR